MRPYPLLFFFILLSVASTAQNIDSLKKILLTSRRDSNQVRVLNNLSGAFLNIDSITQAREYAQTALQLAIKINDKKGQADSYYSVAEVGVHETWTDPSTYDSIKSNYGKALQLYQTLNDPERQGQCQINIGDLYSNEGLYANAIDLYYKSIPLFERSNNLRELAGCYRQINFANFRMENFDEALKNGIKSREIYLQLADSNNVAFADMDIGKTLLNQGKIKEALEIISKGASIILQQNLAYNIPFPYEYLAEGYKKYALISGSPKDTTDYYLRLALENYFTSLLLFRSIDRLDGIAWLQSQIGEFYFDRHDYKKSRLYLDSSLIASIKLNYQEQIRDNYRVLAKLDSAEGNYKDAFLNYHSYIDKRDSLVSKENLQKSVSTSMQFAREREKQIEVAEQARKDADQRRIRNTQYFAIAFLLLAVIGVIIIAILQFKGNKQKQKTNQLLEQQKDRAEEALSNLKSTQAQLIQSEKMASLGQLTAGIAHEIQNPLNFVNNFSDVNKEMMVELTKEMEKGNYVEAKEIVKDMISNEEKINHHGKRADAIVKGMLEHSRQGSGQKQLTDINALADEYLKLAYQSMRAKDKNFDVTMTTDFGNGLEKINIIPQDMGRVLLNLYNNAFYAVNQKKKSAVDVYEPTVSVSSKKNGDKIELRVKDNGNGITHKIIDKIFQPFFTTKPTGSGTGLGLSLSYDIIKAHGGEIKVSTLENEETTFTVILQV